MNTENNTFGQALEAMRAGHLVSRAGWVGKGLRVFMQVPSEVPSEVIHRMTSLPVAAKALAMERGRPLRYSNQFALLFPDNTVNGWVPSSSDALATDWTIHDHHVVAGETVGMAVPMPGNVHEINTEAED
jgi:hypothetical protein